MLEIASFHEAAKAFRNAGDQDGEFKATARLKQRQATEDLEELGPGVQETLLFDAGLCFLKIGDVDAAYKCFQHTNEPGILARLNAAGASTDCSICLTAPLHSERVQLMPCGHSDFCEMCVRALSASGNLGKGCPLCRAVVSAVVQVETNEPLEGFVL